jgi:hypothetical protein
MTASANTSIGKTVADSSNGQLVALRAPVKLPFRGTFRMPFAVDSRGRAAKTHRKTSAFYLADDYQTLFLVEPHERSVGFPTVRLEVRFDP